MLHARRLRRRAGQARCAGSTPPTKPSGCRSTAPVRRPRQASPARRYPQAAETCGRSAGSAPYPPRRPAGSPPASPLPRRPSPRPGEAPRRSFPGAGRGPASCAPSASTIRPPQAGRATRRGCHRAPPPPSARSTPPTPTAPSGPSAPSSARRWPGRGSTGPPCTTSTAQTPRDASEAGAAPEGQAARTGRNGWRRDASNASG